MLLLVLCLLLYCRYTLRRVVIVIQQENCNNLSVKDIVQLDIKLEIQGLQCIRKKLIGTHYFKKNHIITQDFDATFVKKMRETSDCMLTKD